MKRGFHLIKIKNNRDTYFSLLKCNSKSLTMNLQIPSKAHNYLYLFRISDNHVFYSDYALEVKYNDKYAGKLCLKDYFTIQKIMVTDEFWKKNYFGS